jgi:hypothetical protein
MKVWVIFSSSTIFENATGSKAGMTSNQESLTAMRVAR